MTVARTAAEVLGEHATFELECVDRMSVNVYVPVLQTCGSAAWFFRNVRSNPVPPLRAVCTVGVQSCNPPGRPLFPVVEPAICRLPQSRLPKPRRKPVRTLGQGSRATPLPTPVRRSFGPSPRLRSMVQIRRASERHDQSLRGKGGVPDRSGLAAREESQDPSGARTLAKHHRRHTHAGLRYRRCRAQELHPGPNCPLIDLMQPTENRWRRGRVFFGARGGLHHVYHWPTTARMRFLRPTGGTDPPSASNRARNSG